MLYYKNLDRQSIVIVFFHNLVTGPKSRKSFNKFYFVINFEPILYDKKKSDCGDKFSISHISVNQNVPCPLIPKHFPTQKICLV